MHSNGNGSLNGHHTSEAGHALASALYESVDVQVETYLGDTRVTIGALSALRPGEILTLEKNLNEPVELRVNGVTIAHGELVSVGDRFGVRITAIAS